MGLVFVVGLVLALGGLLALAVAGLRSGGSRWAAPLPVLGLLVGIAGGDHGGFVGTAVVWLVLAGLGAQRNSRTIIGAAHAG